MLPLRIMQDLQVADKAVLLRLDLNVPLQDGIIQSDARIQAALPTIRYLLQANARLAIASHLGRPKGKVNKAYSLEPVAMALATLLKKEVLLTDDCIGDGVRNLIRNCRPGELLCLENLRFHGEEEQNDAGFARQLAEPFDCYVNDAFGASHRAHASIVGVVPYIREAAAGMLMVKEVAALKQLLDQPKQPFVAIVGGAKITDKVGVIESLLGKINTLCIGGAMAYTFLQAQGIAIGKSKVEPDRLRLAKEILERARLRHVEVLLPSDHIAAEQFDQQAKAVTVNDANLPEHLMGLDIGPQTIQRYSRAIEGAATVFWNGPMGVFEWPQFAQGTLQLARVTAKNPGLTVVGGGDSVAAIEQAGVAHAIGHISTGGGASLEFLQYGTLPGINVLRTTIH